MNALLPQRLKRRMKMQNLKKFYYFKNILYKSPFNGRVVENTRICKSSRISHQEEQYEF